MAFENIKDIKTVSPNEGHYYFIDANVWVYALNSLHPSHNPDTGNLNYTNFFFDIIDSHLKPRPRIILSSLLMSEIINTYIKKYAMPEYIYQTYTSKGLSKPNFDYKTDYRGNLHFNEHYKLILDDIKSYHESIHLVDDNFSANKPFQFGKNHLDGMDFNDYYYFLISKKIKKDFKNFAFVTNDGDFKIEDFEIYTSTKALLDLKK